MSVAFRISSRKSSIVSLSQAACVFVYNPTLDVSSSNHILCTPVRSWSSATGSTNTSESKNCILVIIKSLSKYFFIMLAHHLRNGKLNIIIYMQTCIYIYMDIIKTTFSVNIMEILS